MAAASLLARSSDICGLVWSDTMKCTEVNRDHTDNVVNLFWPKLMKARNLMARLGQDERKEAVTFIKASLCDDDDDKSPELTRALGAEVTVEQRRAWMRIRDRVENIAHCLLRVQKFQDNLSKIISTQSEETTEV